MSIQKNLLCAIGLSTSFLVSATLSAAPSEKDVNVVNTPNVSVTNTPNVNITNAEPLRVVTTDDYVLLRLSGEFADGSCCLIDTDTGFVPRLDVGQFQGRDLLIEYVSCQALIPPTQPVNLYIGENGQDAPIDALIAIELSEQYRALASDSLSGTAHHASHAVKVIVDSSDDLLLNGRRPVASAGVGRVSCIIAGHLVN